MMRTTRGDHRAPRAKVGAVLAVLATGALLAGAAPALATSPVPTFRARTVVPFASISRLTVADLNHDDRPDLIGATSGANPQLAIALATGAPGSYGTRTDVAVTANGSLGRPVVADLDGDGHQDVLVTRGAAGYAWMMGDGTGAFDPLQTSATAIAEPAVADVVGSDDPDLIAVVGGVATAMTGDGTGAFASSATTFPAPGGPTDIRAEDLDADGRTDVAIAAVGGNPADPATTSSVTTFRAKLDGTFEPGASHTIANIVGDLATGDIDGDGHLDLAVAAPRLGAGAGFYSLFGDGGSFSAPVLTELGYRPEQIVLADVDGDDHLDALVLDGTSSLTYVVPGRGDRTFGPAVAYLSGAAPRDLTVVDATGDGVRDVLTTTEPGSVRPRGVNVLAGHVDGTFDGIAGATDAYQRVQAVGDLTGDGRADLVTAKLIAAANVQVFVNDGKGRLRANVGASFPSTPTALAIGRMNSGPAADVVAVSASGVTVALAAGGGALGTPTTTAGGTTLSSPIVAELTGDGRNDVAAVDGSGNVLVFAGKGSAALAAPKAVAVGSGLVQVASADLDDDGDHDLVALRSSPAQVAVLRSDGSGGFSAPVTTALAATPQFVATGDLDGDGNEDVGATVGTGSASAFVPLIGRGDGTLLTSTPVPLPANPEGSRTAATLDLADLNGDGRDDALVDGARYLLSDCLGVSTPAVASFDQIEGSSILTRAVDMDGDGTQDLVGSTTGSDARVRFGVAPSMPEPSPAAPFRSCRGLVDRVHRDLLQRRATDAEIAASAPAIADGTLAKGDLVAQIRTSADHITNVDPVARLYRAYFLRSPDPSGLDYWVKRRHAGWTLIQISNQFARSSEFVTRYGPLTNTQFVDLVYANVLGRPGDASGRAFWINRLNTGRATRGQVMLNFSDSSEYRTKQAAEVDTGVLFAWMLRRRPSTAELDGAVAALDGGGTVADLAEEIMDSAEYAARVSTT